VIAAVTAPAFAQSLPRYDANAYCQMVAEQGGNSSSVVYNGCIKMEQDAYDSMKSSWESVPAKTRKHCDEVAQALGKGSYVVLRGCLQMESNAAANTPSFQY